MGMSKHTKGGATRRYSKLILLEREMVKYYRENLKVIPDGGYLCHAWQLGYDSAIRLAKKVRVSR